MVFKTVTAACALALFKVGPKELCNALADKASLLAQALQSHVASKDFLITLSCAALGAAMYFDYKRIRREIDALSDDENRRRRYAFYDSWEEVANTAWNPIIDVRRDRMSLARAYGYGWRRR